MTSGIRDSHESDGLSVIGVKCGVWCATHLDEWVAICYEMMPEFVDTQRDSHRSDGSSARGVECGHHGALRVRPTSMSGRRSSCREDRSMQARGVERGRYEHKHPEAVRARLLCKSMDKCGRWLCNHLYSRLAMNQPRHTVLFPF